MMKSKVSDEIMLSVIVTHKRTNCVIPLTVTVINGIELYT